MTDRALLQQALEALEWNLPVIEDYGDREQLNRQHRAITTLRERLAQPEQEPVCAHGIGKTKCSFCHQPQPEQEPVAHTLNCVCGAVWDVSPDGVEEMVHAPNPPQRKPLTEKRIEELYSFWVVDCQDIVGFARAVERTVKGEA